MSWYYIFIPPYAIPGINVASAVGTILGPSYQDFKTALIMTRNSRSLSGQRAQLFQYINGAWTEVPVA